MFFLLVIVRHFSTFFYSYFEIHSFYPKFPDPIEKVESMKGMIQTFIYLLEVMVWCGAVKKKDSDPNYT